MRPTSARVAVRSCSNSSYLERETLVVALFGPRRLCTQKSNAGSVERKMNPKLEELTKRLPHQPGAEEQSGRAVELGTWELGEIVECVQSKLPSKAHRATDAMAAAVSTVFSKSSALQSSADEFARAAEQIEKLSKAATQAFGPLHAFYDQLAKLADSFESLRLFQSQLEGLSKKFEPVSLLHDQVAQLTVTFEAELGLVVKALDPAKDLSDRVSQLSRSLLQANELQADFAELYATFKNADQSCAPSLDGVEAQPSLH